MSDLSTRPLTIDDAEAVYGVMAALETAETGSPTIELADILADWSEPGYDVAAHTVGVFEGDRLLGYAEHVGHDRGDLAHLPGRSELLPVLAGHLVELARRAGAERVGLPMPAGSGRDVRLAELGWQARWSSWQLELPEGAAIPDRPLPEGYVVRAAEEAEHEACWTVIEDAFLEWSQRPRVTFDQWAARSTRRLGWESWLLRVVVSPVGEVVAVAVLRLSENGDGYVDQLATRADHRGLGLAQALLADAYREARAHGARRSTLTTDSRTGALGLYEHVGMVVVSTWVNRATATGVASDDSGVARS